MEVMDGKTDSDRNNDGQGENRREIYCWTVRWQERGHEPMFRHFYPKTSEKGEHFGYTEKEVRIFVLGVQTNTNIQHSSMDTIYRGSHHHKAMMSASEETSKLLKTAMNGRRKPKSVRFK